MRNTILVGDVRTQLTTLPDESVHCVVTSPPYWGLRDYGADGQIGLEPTPEEYVCNMVAVFREVRRVLRSDGTLWLNMGDSYFGDSPARKSSAEGFSKEWNPADSAGNGGKRRSAARLGDLKPKDLVGIPWMVAFALRADGWWLRSDIIWSKPNPMPESVTDRPTKAHEYVFLLSKSKTYYYDHEAIKERQTGSTVARAAYGWAGVTDDGSNGARTGSTYKRMAENGELMGTIPSDGFRNKRTVWEVATEPFPEAHFATYPPALIRPCILAGCPEGGVVLDPFFGSGTTGIVALTAARDFIGIELNPDYVAIAERRLAPLLMQGRLV